MATTYTLIKGETIGSSAASYTFTAIPSTFTDLVVRVSARDTSTTSYPNDLYVRVNSITTGYSFTNVEGYAASAGSQRSSGANYQIYYAVTSNSQTSNTFASTEIYIPNYAGSTNKPASSVVASPQNSTSNVVDSATAHLLSNTAAITSLVITTANNFLSGSSFYLYGISNS